MRLPTILLPLALAAMPMMAHAGDVAPLGKATIRSTDLATVAARGAQLYQYDQAAWHTTDTMRAADLPRETLAAMRGWVVEPHGETLTVTYYGMKDGKPFALYLADFQKGSVSNGHIPTPTEQDLSPLGQRMVAAHDIAPAQTFPRCVPRPFNSVVLPPDGRGVVPVYLLTPMTENGAYPFGGHHEIDVAADGTIVGMRDFTRSCIAMKNAGPDKGGKTVGLFISHTLDPHPTEIHVYLSLWSRTPVFVGTGTQVWEVAGTRIRPVQMGK